MRANEHLLRISDQDGIVKFGCGGCGHVIILLLISNRMSESGFGQFQPKSVHKCYFLLQQWCACISLHVLKLFLVFILFYGWLSFSSLCFTWVNLDLVPTKRLKPSWKNSLLLVITSLASGKQLRFHEWAVRKKIHSGMSQNLSESLFFLKVQAGRWMG